MIERDEVGTLSRLFALRAQLVEPLVRDHGGRVFNTTGDGLLAEFASAVSAVEAGIAVQSAAAAQPAVDAPLRLRVGIHVGDVLARDGDLFGDGVNLAARLEGAADPGGVLISASTHAHVAGPLADEFEAVGELRLKNISRSIHGWRWRRSTAPPRVAAELGGPPLIAVLPFQSLSGGDVQGHLADGMVEDLITELSRFHWFRVVARSSSEAVDRAGVDSVEAGRRLGARFVVEGSIRRSNDRIRLTVRLLDVPANRSVWSERFDRVVEDLFDLQDDLVQALSAAIVPEYVAAWRVSGPTRPTLPSWDLAMQAWGEIYRASPTPASMDAARSLFERALDDDPDSTLALGGLAFTLINPWYHHSVPRDFERAMKAARRATEIDERDAFAWSLLGHVESFRGELDNAERHLRRGLALNPSLALAAIWLALVHGFRGEREHVETWARHALQLSPLDPFIAVAHVARALASFVEEDYGASATWAARSLESAPDHLPGCRLLAASLELSGDHAGAQATVRSLLALGPVTTSWLRENLFPFGGQDTLERYLGALADAGIPD